MATANLASASKNGALAVLSPRLASKSPSQIALRQWFVTFAELKREEFSKTFIDVWCDALSDLEPEWIQFGCRVYFRSMKFFPMPGDIREIVELEKHSRDSLQRARRIANAMEVENIDVSIEESSRRQVPVREVIEERRRKTA